MADSDKKQCSCCKELINKKADVCHHCGRNQKRWIRTLSQVQVTSWIAIIVSIVLLYLSIKQFDEARSQTISAKEAAKSANEAVKRVEAVEERIKKVTKATIQGFELLSGKTGIADGGDSANKAIEKARRIIGDALIENKIPSEKKME